VGFLLTTAQQLLLGMTNHSDNFAILLDLEMKKETLTKLLHLNKGLSVTPGIDPSRFLSCQGRPSISVTTL
jgi:hypothetical protein